MHGSPPDRLSTSAEIPRTVSGTAPPSHSFGVPLSALHKPLCVCEVTERVSTPVSSASVRHNHRGASPQLQLFDGYIFRLLVQHGLEDNPASARGVVSAVAYPRGAPKEGAGAAGRASVKPRRVAPPSLEGG